MTSTPSLQPTRFRPTAGDVDGVDAPTAAWLRAVGRGFNGPSIGSGRAERFGRALVERGGTLTSVHAPVAAGSPADPADPVGTMTGYPGSIQLGGDEPLPVRQVTAVTVRPTHRRRGILRSMMTAELRDAADAGVAVAALTVTEGGIYERFGFGVATWRRRIAVDTGPRFQLRERPAGSVELVDAAWLAERHGELFARFHASAHASVTRGAGYLDRWLLQEGSAEPNRALRGAVHLDGSGEIDGCLFYSVSDDADGTVEVHDLLAWTPDAELGLWDLVAAIDLTSRATFVNAALREPLELAVVDPRTIRTEALGDELWLRVLDPAAAFSARAYSEGVRPATVRVTDPLGHADGVYRIDPAADGPAATRVGDDEPADLEAPVAALAPLLVGSVPVSELVEAGRASVADASSIARLDALFGGRPVPRFRSHF